MYKKRKRFLRTICRKITVLFLSMLAITLLFNGIVSMCCLYFMETTSLKNSLVLGETAAEDAKKALEVMAEEQLLGSATEKAAYIEEKFNTVISGVNGIARMAEDIYRNPESYPDRKIPLPLKDSRELAAQLLWSERLTASEEEYPYPPEQTKEILKLGNLQDMLIQYNRNNEMISSVYLATESGWMIQADYIAYSKYSGNSQVPDFYEAETREWYQWALLTEMGETVYSDIIKDIHEGKDCIVCAQPVYVDGEIVAVAGIGSYLDVVNEVVLNTDIGESGYAFLVNEYGQILVSGADEGETAAVSAAEENTDLRKSTNAELAEAAEDMVCGGSEFVKITVDDREVYLAYAPLEGLDWSFAVILEVEEVAAPAQKSQEEILLLTENMSGKLQKSVQRTFLIFLVAGVLEAALASITGLLFAKKLTGPLHQLTEEITKIGTGNLDRQIRITSGDEVEKLGNAFNKMAVQLKEYITNLAVVTADKERICAELSVAAGIQADMLPDSRTILTDRKEFTLHACTFPAKEVGGDFYDFFLTDEDHLAFLVADVSGKGVPAALFMVVAKTLIENHVMQGETPAQAFTAVNRALCRNNRNHMFLTAWMGILQLSDGRVTYVNAGHNSPLLLQQKEGCYTYIKQRTGFILAGMEDTVYEQKELQLFWGDTLFLYSDGVTEANDEQGRLFGEKRLKELLDSHTQELPEPLCHRVMAALQEHQGKGAQFDDITMLALRYQPMTEDIPWKAADGKRTDFVQKEDLSWKACDKIINRRNTGEAALERQQEIMDFLEKILKENQISSKNIRQILIAADEIFSNICYYSGAEATGCSCEITDGQIRISFEDDGRAFNPLQKEKPDISKPLEERKEGGLGIYLVQQVMDEVKYCRKDGKNCLILIKNR